MALKTTKRTCPRCSGSGEIDEADGASLREAREAAGVTLGEMARRIGCSTPYLSDAERGNRKVTPRLIAEYRKLGGKR